MEVESTGAVKKDDGKQRKVLIIILAALIAIVFALTVSIVVVILTRDNGENEPLGGVELSYEEYRAEIENKINELGEQEDSTAIEEIYKPYLNDVQDEKVRAMLLQDYYFEIMSYDYTQKRKNEVINGMIEGDDILQTETSGLNVKTAAYYYNDNKTSKKYETILKERGYTNEIQD